MATKAEIDTIIDDQNPDNTSNLITPLATRTSQKAINAGSYNLETNDTDDQIEGTTNLFVEGAAQRSKIQNLPADTSTDLTNLTNKVDAVEGSTKIVGDWDASSGTFPTALNTTPATAPIQGYKYVNQNVGSVTIDGVVFEQYDQLTALVDSASSTSFADWSKQDFKDDVVSVNGQQGVVVLDLDDTADTATRKALNVTTQTIEGPKTFSSVSTFSDTAIGNQPIVNETASFEIGSTHINRLVTLDITGAFEVRLTDATNTALSIGNRVDVVWLSDSGTNTVTVVESGSVAVVSFDDLRDIEGVGAGVSIVKTANNQFWVVGRLA